MEGTERQCSVARLEHYYVAGFILVFDVEILLRTAKLCLWMKESESVVRHG